MQELDPGIGECGVGDEVAVGNVTVGDERGEGVGFCVDLLVLWRDSDCGWDAVIFVRG